MKEKFQRLNAAKKEFEDALNALEGFEARAELVPRDVAKSMFGRFGPYDLVVKLEVDTSRIRFEGENP